MSKAIKWTIEEDLALWRGWCAGERGTAISRSLGRSVQAAQRRITELKRKGVWDIGDETEHAIRTVYRQKQLKDDEVDRAHSMRASGLLWKDIAKSMGVKSNTIIDAVKRKYPDVVKEVRTDCQIPGWYEPDRPECIMFHNGCRISVTSDCDVEARAFATRLMQSLSEIKRARVA